MIRDIRFFINTILCMDRRTLFIHKSFIFRYNEAIEKSLTIGLPKNGNTERSPIHKNWLFHFLLPFLLSKLPKSVWFGEFGLSGIPVTLNSFQYGYPGSEFRSGVFIWLKKRVSAARSATAWKSLCLICIYLGFKLENVTP